MRALLLLLIVAAVNAQVGLSPAPFDTSGLTNSSGVAYVPADATRKLKTDSGFLFTRTYGAGGDAVLTVTGNQTSSLNLTASGEGKTCLGSSNICLRGDSDPDSPLYRYLEVLLGGSRHMMVSHGRSELGEWPFDTALGVGQYAHDRRITLSVRAADDPPACSAANTALKVIGGRGSCTAAGSPIWLETGQGGSTGGNGGDLTIRTGAAGAGGGRSGRVIMQIGGATGPSATLDEAGNLTLAGGGKFVGTTPAPLLFWHPSFSPADATAYHFSQAATPGSAELSRSYVPSTGTITNVVMYCSLSTRPTNEAGTLSFVINGVETTLDSAFAFSTSNYYSTYSYAGLNIPVTRNDVFSLKLVTPTWATNPVSVICRGYGYYQ